MQSLNMPIYYNRDGRIELCAQQLSVFYCAENDTFFACHIALEGRRIHLIEIHQKSPIAFEYVECTL